MLGASVEQEQGKTHRLGLHIASIPLMTREAFAQAIGLPLGVLVAQAERGYWPEVKVGKRSFINVEVVRQKLLERGQEFSL